MMDGWVKEYLPRVRASIQPENEREESKYQGKLDIIEDSLAKIRSGSVKSNTSVSLQTVEKQAEQSMDSLPPPEDRSEQIHAALRQIYQQHLQDPNAKVVAPADVAEFEVIKYCTNTMNNFLTNRTSSNKSAYYKMMHDLAQTYLPEERSKEVNAYLAEIRRENIKRGITTGSLYGRGSPAHFKTPAPLPGPDKPAEKPQQRYPLI